METTSRPSTLTREPKLAGGSQGRATAMATAANLGRTPLKLKRLLVPYDFSEHSRKALDTALALARHFGSEIILANVLEYEGFGVDSVAFPLEAWWADREETTTEALKKLALDTGLKVTPIVCSGRAWDEVVRIAQEMKVDLIVIATHGRTGLRHFLIGSVAERIVQHAPCPVLTIRVAANRLKTARPRRAPSRRV